MTRTQTLGSFSGGGPYRRPDGTVIVSRTEQLEMERRIAAANLVIIQHWIKDTREQSERLHARLVALLEDEKRNLDVLHGGDE